MVVVRHGSLWTCGAFQDFKEEGVKI